MISRLSEAELPAFRFLHDITLQVRYDDAFYASLAAGEDDRGHALYSYAATDASGALVGGLSVRLSQRQPPGSAQAGASPSSWGWGGWLLPLQYLTEALQALWVGEEEEEEEEGGGGKEGRVEEGQAAAPPLAAYIMTLCVAEGARRRGVARALLAALIAELQAHSPPCSTLELHMLEGNTAAMHLYTSMGFAMGERQVGYYYFEGRSHDAFYWRRGIQSSGSGSSSESIEVSTVVDSNENP